MSTSAAPHIVSIDEIREAADRIRGVATRTPLLAWDDTTWLKPESLQPVGAFKMRGAYNKIASLTEEERARGVVTYSSGNHAQAVARAARVLDVEAVICMPRGRAPQDLSATRRRADRSSGRTPRSGDHRRGARAEQGLCMVPPFDDPMVIAGQGTLGLEILEDVPDVEAILCPGGRRALAGVAAAAVHSRPQVKIIGVEPERANCMYLSLRNQGITEIGYPETVADGLRPVKPGRLPFESAASSSTTSSRRRDGHPRGDAQLARHGRLVVEPSGAIAFAAHLADAAPRRDSGDARVIVISGGNVTLTSTCGSSPTDLPALVGHERPSPVEAAGSDAVLKPLVWLALSPSGAGQRPLQAWHRCGIRCLGTC